MLHHRRHPFHPSFREQKSLYQELHIWLWKRKRTKAPEKRFWLRLGMPESESQKNWEVTKLRNAVILRDVCSLGASSWWLKS